MIILGFDLSLSDTGWAALEINDDGTYAVIASGHVPTAKRKGKIVYSTGRRLARISDEITRLMDTFTPDLVVKESSFSNGNSRATQQIFKVNGIFELIVFHSPARTFKEVAPTTVKKVITGNGRNSKEEVARIVQELTGVRTANDNVTDAIAVALTQAIKDDLIQIEHPTLT